MKNSSPGALVAGNLYDKFNSRNPVAQILMGQYKHELRDLVLSLPSLSSVLEVGCGEGYLIEFVTQFAHASIYGLDLDQPIVSEAKQRCPAAGLIVADGQCLPYAEARFDLVIVCEMLEHVDNPDKTLREIARVSKRYCLFSVPREPIWRILNLLRGAHVRALGNSYGHVQHWSSREFVQLLNQHFRVLKVSCPLPWTMALCEVHA